MAEDIIFPGVTGLHVRILRYRGRNGDRDTRTQTMYRTDIVSSGGIVSVDGWSTPGGYASVEYAVEVAERHAEVLGCPIRFAEEKETRTTTVVYDTSGDSQLKQGLGDALKPEDPRYGNI